MYKLIYTILLRIREENEAFNIVQTFYLFLLMNYPDTYPLRINGLQNYFKHFCFCFVNLIVQCLNSDMARGKKQINTFFPDYCVFVPSGCPMAQLKFRLLKPVSTFCAYLSVSHQTCCLLSVTVEGSKLIPSVMFLVDSD